MDTDIDAVMGRVSPYLDMWDGILRRGHSVYKSYPPELAIDHDSSAQAHCTSRHILSQARQIFLDAPNIRHFNLRGQNLWLFEDAGVLVRLKKTGENGVSSNYPTRQARDFGSGETMLPGFLPEPTRLNVGYLLDVTGLRFVRSQVAIPIGTTGTLWCAAIVPQDERQSGQCEWRDVTREPRFRTR